MMTFQGSRPVRSVTVGSRIALIGFVLGGIGAPSAMAQVVIPSGPSVPAATVLLVQAEVSDKVALLHDLGLLESDARLALLLSEKQVSPSGQAHASDLIQTVWPDAKDRLMSAGIEDLEPYLTKLAEAGTLNELHESGRDVMIALTSARSKLAASDADIAASVLSLTAEAATEINASGPTPLEDYQDAWSLLVVARSEADLLVHATDPVIAKAASKIILALDDALIFLPDPASTAPSVEVDPAILLDAVAKVKQLAGSGT